VRTTRWNLEGAPTRRSRLVRGAALFLGLVLAAVVLHQLAEWRQALANVDAMIVTPVVINLPTDVPANEAGAVAAAATQPGRVGRDAQDELPGTAVPVELAALPQLNQEVLHILLLGTDARSTDTMPTRTDAIVLVRVERDRGRVSMISIPRDLWISYANGSQGRINAVYAIGEQRYGPGGGAALAKTSVGKLLGLTVDNVVLVNFQGFKTLIDKLGGITVDVPRALHDPAYPTDEYTTIDVRFRAGVQQMDGERALMYARTRHADSDFGRNQRQQLVLIAIFERIRERGPLEQLGSLDDYTGVLRDNVQTDLTKERMLELVGFARGINADEVRRYAIDSSMIVELHKPATFAAEPEALSALVREFTGSPAVAGGK